MLITTLGTSHGDHTYCRFNSSTLFETKGSLYLIDSGAPVNGLLIRAGKDFGKIRAVFITHMHDDHVGGLPGLIKTLIKYPVDGQHTDIFLPEEGVMPALIGWLEAQHLSLPPELITLKTTKPGTIYDDGTLRVGAIGTRHLEHPDYPISFCYDLRAEGKKIMCTGDLTSDFSDFPKVLLEKEYDLCICEATHYPPECALPVLIRCKLKNLVFNHIHNPWHGEGEEKLKAYYASLPYPVRVAHDSDEFIV